MPRSSLADLEKRVAALEHRSNGGPLLIAFMPRADDGSHAGYECIPGNGLSEIVWRADGESEDGMRDRARATIQRLRREGGAAGAVAYCLGVDAQGVSL